VGLHGRSAVLSNPVHRTDNLMLRSEMESPWGYGQIVSWYEQPSTAERMQVENALKHIGWPPHDKLDRDRLDTLFLDHADQLIGREAAIRSSIREARSGTR